MFKIFRTFLLILFLVSTTTAVYSETSWITKKSDKTKVELKKDKSNFSIKGKSFDATQFINNIMDDNVPSNLELLLSDLNEDGNVNVQDCILLINIILSN